MEYPLRLRSQPSRCLFSPEHDEHLSNGGKVRCQMKSATARSAGQGKGSALDRYRKLCMLDTTGKLLEELLRTRLIDPAGGLAENQYGFRKLQSTMGTLGEVVEEARTAWMGNHRSHDACVCFKFDLKNAFNSVKWSDIMSSLKKCFKVPIYIRRGSSKTSSESRRRRNGRETQRRLEGPRLGALAG